MPPPPVDVSTEDIREMCRRHGISVTSVRQLPAVGIINTVYALDDRFVLRVPRNHPAHIEQAFAEAAAIPIAVTAGVRTPPLVAFDDSCEVVEVPVLIVEWTDGVDMESARADPRACTAAWREVGLDLGRLHANAPTIGWPSPTGPDAPLVAQEPTDLAELLESRTADGWFSYVEEAWFARWIERLGPHSPAAAAATHGDLQMSNVLVVGEEYRALLDWGCAAVKDPVVDFMPMPFAAVPPMLEGHRQIAPLPDDETAERRILQGRLHTLLAVLPRGPAPDMTWGERPTAWLTDLVRFFQDPPSKLWRDLAPDP